MQRLSTYSEVFLLNLQLKITFLRKIKLFVYDYGNLKTVKYITTIM